MKMTKLKKLEKTKSAKTRKEEVEIEIEVDVTEDVNALFDGQDLTEDFKAHRG